ncbi:hypothetical protein [Campylobacter rectus]|uniref:hypothetical protein n=1 Tax=Campylobacter rectus TaxID=203 RepID=UPI0028EC88BE|nr:hypothetical protein [Campylobacter rectus]
MNPSGVARRFNQRPLKQKQLNVNLRASVSGDRSEHNRKACEFAKTTLPQPHRLVAYRVFHIVNLTLSVLNAASLFHARLKSCTLSYQSSLAVSYLSAAALLRAATHYNLRR